MASTHFPTLVPTHPINEQNTCYTSLYILPKNNHKKLTNLFFYTYIKFGNLKKMFWLKGQKRNNHIQISATTKLEFKLNFYILLATKVLVRS